MKKSETDHKDRGRNASSRGAPGQERSSGQGSADPRFTPPAVSLPKGGGAIQGIGEKLSTNPVNGTSSLAIPLPLSPGRSGFTPSMALDYDSGAGNGPYGYGWRVGSPSITRRTDRGIPQYRDREDSDVFVLSGADDLVPALRPDGTHDQQLRDGYLVARYRPRIEGTFARIERWTHAINPADVFWRTISRDNLTSVFGRTAASRIADPADPSRIFTWLLCETFDDRGNASVHEYVAEDGSGVDRGLASESNRGDASRSSNRYLKRVKYGNRTSRLVQPDLSSMEWLFELVMDYGDHEGVTPDIHPSRSWPVRPDPFSVYRAGFEVRTYRRCQRILMFHRFAELGAAPRLVRSLELDYDDFAYAPGFSTRAELAHPGSTRHSSVLRRVTAFGHADDGVRAAMPPLELTYSRPHVHEDVQLLAPGSEEGLPTGVDGDMYQWLDLHGEGLAGVLSEQGRAWWYKPNLGDGRLGPPQLVARRPSPGLAGSQLLDLAGDGSLDLVQLEGPVTGFFERDAQGWSSLRPFTSLPELDWRDPNLRFVDLTGDGRADLLITHDDQLHWHPSLGEDGFGPRRSVAAAIDEARGPRLVLADATETIFLADLTGDGLTDLVRIRHAQICYWPNLGYGRFGPKVTMDHAPVLDTPERFDPRRVRLADIDGSGTTDLLYLGGDGIRLYFNRAGNGWTAPYTLSGFPGIDVASTVQVTDLRGNGTACLVWSSSLPGDSRAPLRFVDLMGGIKPHLLVRVENNLGARTVIEYAPSTRFYLEDQRAGRPWITRLPFPVHVVERVITYDDISRNRFVTRYAYHHGHFDGVEREFRGFGMVEQIDTEELAALSAEPSQPPASNVALASHVPPVLTRTWYHTGLHLGRDVVSRFHAGLRDGTDAGEYYREPGLTDAEAERLLLEDTTLPPGLTLAEEREACRALKGAILRQEIYALDGTDRQPHPYSVTEQNATVRMLQPMGTNRHAVFFTHPRESLVYHYERRPEDPRITHELVLEADEFGNVLRAASVAYGRRQPDPELEAGDQATQAAVHVVYAENAVTNAIQSGDAHRTPVPAESRSYELTGLAPPAGGRFTLAQLRTAGAGAAELAYEQAPSAGLVQKRLIERSQTLYRRDDLTAALPLGQVESLALPFEAYQLAFTPGLVSGVYGTRITAAMLAGGGYVHRDGDLQWWIPSGRAFLSPGDGDTPAVELAHARQHFFLPRRYQDPFGQTTRVAFDGYDLLLAEVRDALDNRTTVGERDASGAVVSSGHDYRVQQARVMTDANGNRAAVRFDALGMVVGTAVMGKLGEVPRRGDLLDGFVADLPDEVIAAHLALPLQDPLAILGRATTRLVYDRLAYHRTKAQPRPSPVVAYTLSRETHDADLAPGTQTATQHAFVYSDGFGREIQRKSQAEPDPTAPSASARWVGSGWTVLNNKGLPVRQFEPFFTSTHLFESEVQIGVSPILCYDPLGRGVATIHPDHTWEKQTFDPWRQVSWDVNDTAVIADPRLDHDVGDHFRRLPEHEYLPTWYARRQAGGLGPDEQVAATRTAAHADTPARSYADSLGRTFLTIAHNRFAPVNTPAEPTIEEHYATRVAFDVEGNQREIIDARDRIVFHYDYDMLGRRIHQAGMEAGARWTLADVAGMPIHVHDSRGHHSRTEYDALRRPVRAFVKGAVAQAPTAEILFGQIEYGEGQPDDAQRNLRGRPFRCYDSAGVVTNDAYDFKGNPLQVKRQLAQQYRTVLDWSASPVLEAELFTSTVAYDALDRPIEVTAPDTSIFRPGYNEANLLERVDVHVRDAAEPTAFVVNIDYDAKGQRQRIDYGNEVRTEYAYDPLTFRLVGAETTRLTDQAKLQDLRYTYDAIGNILQISDNAQQTTYFNNQVVTPDNSYVYDAIYRLIRADGREHIGQALQPQTTWNDQFRAHMPHPGDGQAMRRYREHYRYDAAGNFLELIHLATGGNWTRGYTYDAPSALEPTKHSNCLTSTSVGADPSEGYTYDAHGNVTAMPHLTAMQWDFRDRLCTTSRQAVSQGTAETTYYVYDAGGQRVRKVTERQNGTRKSERIYLGGTEIYREYDAAGIGISLERGTLHVMDDQRRIALVETRVQGTEPGVPVRLIRYQLANQLGSTSLELDHQAQIASYEEYFPYGSTSYQAVQSQVGAPKRYRYVAMERDEETGFAYHTARYYLPWLGRWLSADPIGVDGGLNLYAYCDNNPINRTDTNGQNWTLEGINKHIDSFPDRRITMEEVARAGPIKGVTLGDWAIMMKGSDNGGYRVDPQVQTMIDALVKHRLTKTADAFARRGEQQDNALQMDTRGNTYTRREAREAGERHLKRHQDPKRLAATAVVATAIVAPEAVAAVVAFDTGVKTGETITGIHSGARVSDLVSGGTGKAGTPMTSTERGKAGVDAALGWAAIGLGALLTSTRGSQVAAPEPTARGARGTWGDRTFDLSAAGGPIRGLSTQGVRVTTRGIDVVERHLARFGPDAANQGMVARLRAIASGKLEATAADLNFYTHELREFVRYRRLGFPTGAGDDYTLWNNAHSATLADYGLVEGPGVLYHPSVAP